jgi:hypothetical protein
MKNKAILLQLIAIAGLLLALTLVSKSCLNGRAEKARLESDLATYGTNHTDLALTKKELKTELKKDKTEYRIIDSLAKAEKAATKQIESVYVAKVNIDNKDSVPLTNRDTVAARHSSGIKQYTTPFADSRNCIAVTGLVISTDSSPTVIITSQKAEIETYDITFKRKWFQFWRPRKWVKTYTKCGDLQVIKINAK